MNLQLQLQDHRPSEEIAQENELQFLTVYKNLETYHIMVIPLLDVQRARSLGSDKRNNLPHTIHDTVRTYIHIYTYSDTYYIHTKTVFTLQKYGYLEEHEVSELYCSLTFNEQTLRTISVMRRDATYLYETSISDIASTVVRNFSFILTNSIKQTILYPILPFQPTLLVTANKFNLPPDSCPTTIGKGLNIGTTHIPGRSEAAELVLHTFTLLCEVYQINSRKLYPEFATIELQKLIRTILHIAVSPSE